MSTSSNKIITLQELIYAQVDAFKLEQIMNEAPWVEIQTRLGRKCYSIATISAIIEQFQLDTQTALSDLQKAIAQIIEGGVPDLAVLAWTGRTQREENKALAKSVFYHIDTLVDADKYVGYIVEYQGKHFKVSAEQSQDIRHPIIKVGSVYLIPRDYTTLNFNIGELTLVGTINNPAEFSKSNGKSQQGMLIDNQNKSVFVSSCTVNESVLTGKIFEYDFTNGNLGALKTTSGELSLGHADFFAITTDGSSRHLWFYKPPISSGQYGAGGHIVRVLWGAGCSDAQIDLSISVAEFDATRRLEVSNYDSDHLLVRGEFDYIIPISELNAGRLTVVEKRTWQWTENIIDVVAPRQQSKAVCNVQASASGVFVKQDDAVFVGLSSLDTNRTSVTKIYQSDATDDCELEGLDFWWNAEKLQFESLISTWEWQTGIVKLLNITSNKVKKNTVFSMRYFTTSVRGQTGGNARNTAYTPMNIACSGLLIGGNHSPTRTGDTVFNPADFFIEQWASGAGGRYSARIVYDVNRIMLDSSKDTVLPAGYRYQINNDVIAQITEHGLNVGKSRNKSVAQVARIDVSSDTMPAVHASALVNDMPAYVASSNYCDFASTGSVKLGTYSTSTNIATRLAYLNASVFTAYSDNTIDLGTAALRFKNSYFSTAPTVSSDERLKQQFRSQTEAEKAVALEIKDSICLYKFNDAVDLKGDGARWHVGVKAQQVISIMQSHGLDPFRYGFVCFDEWDEQKEIKETGGDEFDEDGNLIRNAGYCITQDAREAGSRYAIRYDELAMFILAVL